MKKFLPILAVVALSTILILLLVSRMDAGKNTKTISVDLTEGEKISEWKGASIGFQELGENKGSTRGVYYQKISPIDGIYYRSAAREPIQIENKGNTRVLTLGRWVFICNLQDITVSYEIRIKGLAMTPMGRWIFLVDTSKKEPTIFSYNSFLQVRLLADSSDPVIDFSLFPSLLFRYDPTNTMQLKGADIVRVATIDSIRYLDAKDRSNIASIFWTDASEDIDLFFVARDDIMSRIQAFNTLYKQTVALDLQKFDQDLSVDPANPLFVNDTKKEILLKNKLLRQILWALKADATSDALKKDLWSTLDAMRQMNPELFAEGMALIKKYLYIAAYVSFSSDQKEYALIGKEGAYSQAVKDIIRPSSDKNQWGYYQGILYLFSRYYFTDLAFTEFNATLQEYLWSLLNEKNIKKHDFLSFSFFLTQYLSTGPVVPDENTLKILSYLFSVTDEYYRTIPEADKRSVALSTIFYSYNKSFTKLLQVFAETFFDIVLNKTLILKSQYVQDTLPLFSDGFLDTYKDLVNRLGADLTEKKQAFYTSHTTWSGSDIDDNFILLSQTYEHTNQMRYILFNYPEYIKKLELNNRSKRAHGILIEKSEAMSQESLDRYLKDFNNVDLSTLQIVNNYRGDGFYDIRIDILGNHFALRLWPEDHTIADISYIDMAGKKHVFPNVVIKLDQKKQQMAESYNSASDTMTRDRYDFKNFFVTVLLRGLDTKTSVPIAPLSSIGAIDPSSVDRPPMTTEMQLFIQKELLEKDFKNIADTLSIGLANVYVAIKNESYAIDLSGIKKTVKGRDTAYPIEFESKYVFDRHVFYQLSFRVRSIDTNEYEFGGNTIQISPSRISLTSLEDTFKFMGTYIDAIKKSYQGERSIQIDLAQKKILLDGKEFIPDFTTH